MYHKLLIRIANIVKEQIGLKSIICLAINVCSSYIDKTQKEIFLDKYKFLIVNDLLKFPLIIIKF